MPVGQIVGSMNEVRPVADVMAELVSGFEDAVAASTNSPGVIRRREGRATDEHQRRAPAGPVVVALAVAAGTRSGARRRRDRPPPVAVPGAHAAGRLRSGRPEETDIQGRVPLRDYDSGRVDQGYRCNTEQVAHQGTTGGFKVLRYRDSQGTSARSTTRRCCSPRTCSINAAEGLGVVVLDMNDPRTPRKTADLTSPRRCRARTSRCCSTRSAACWPRCSATRAPTSASSTSTTCTTDCRHPQLLSSTPTGRARPRERLRARRAGPSTPRAPAGRRWSRSTSPTRPTPKPIFQQFGVNYHGLRLSDDGRTMYVANIGNPTERRSSPRRAADPRRLRDPGPQGRPRGQGASPTSTGASARSRRSPSRSPATAATTCSRSTSSPTTRRPVGRPSPSARSAPPGSSTSTTRGTRAWSPTCGSRCTSPTPRNGDQQHDPGALSPVQGYAGHYCSLPDAQGPEARRLLDDRRPACGSSTSATCGTRRRSATSTSRSCRAQPPNPDGPGALRDVAARVGRRRAGRSGTPTQHRVLRRQADQRGRAAAASPR